MLEGDGPTECGPVTCVNPLDGERKPGSVGLPIPGVEMRILDNRAIEAAQKLGGLISDEVARRIPWVQPVKAAPYFAHAQFSEPDTVLALSDLGDGLPYVKAMWHYARGIAFAANGNARAARNEADALTDVPYFGEARTSL